MPSERQAGERETIQGLEANCKKPGFYSEGERDAFKESFLRRELVYGLLFSKFTLATHLKLESLLCKP